MSKGEKVQAWSFGVTALYTAFWIVDWGFSRAELAKFFALASLMVLVGMAVTLIWEANPNA